MAAWWLRGVVSVGIEVIPTHQGPTGGPFFVPISRAMKD